MLKSGGPAVVVNIGGVSNITYIDGETLIACDTGPGNALLDDFMLRRTGEAVDRDGKMAAKGHADQDWMRAHWIVHSLQSLRRSRSTAMTSRH
jgi:anhydro-N-acetylmuramic acid kinase